MSGIDAALASNAGRSLSFDRENGRALGADMIAERWIVIGGDHIIWLHEPSHRCVSVREASWDRCSGIPAAYGEPSKPDADGYIVGCAVHDENGNPTDGECFWIESYGQAVRHARAIRRSVIGAKPMPAPEQIAMFDEESQS